MIQSEYEKYWHMIPVGRNNAVEYPALVEVWGMCERAVRKILHELSQIDNGDDYVLIRSSKSKGFYRTDDKEDIATYRAECLRKGKSIFSAVKKCNRILRTDTTQYSLDNNLRTVRDGRKMLLNDVCARMRKYGKVIDAPMLSKMENSVCLPTPEVLSILAQIYGCEPSELIKADLPQ